MDSIIQAAIILALSILGYALIQRSYHVKPRKLLTQLSVSGPTCQGEEMFTLVASLFEDESPEERQRKVDEVCLIRERRLEFQNQRMLDITARGPELIEEAKKILEKEGLKVIAGDKI